MIPEGMMESWGHCGGRGGSLEHDRVTGPPQGTQDSKGDGRAMGPSEGTGAPRRGWHTHGDPVGGRGSPWGHRGHRGGWERPLGISSGHCVRGARCTALGARCCTPLGAHLRMLLSSWRCVALLQGTAHLPLPVLGTRPGRTGCCSRMLAVSCLPSKAPRRRRFPVALSAPTAAAGARPGCAHAHAWGVHVGACTSRVQGIDGCTRKRGRDSSVRLQTGEGANTRVGACTSGCRRGAACSSVCMLQPGSSPCSCTDTSVCMVQARTVSV